jgi:catechol-2,3-dioxygenase
MLNAHALFTSPHNFKQKSKGPLISSLRLETICPLGELQQFYEKVIGLIILESTRRTLVIQAGKSNITFNKVESDKRPFYHFAFNIPENKIESAFAWQRTRTPIVHPNLAGLKDSIVNFRHWNAHSVFFLDPAGNLLEYIARHDLKNSSAGDFSATDILYVSEIGFIVDDVQKTGAAFIKSLNLNSYRPAAEKFWPIGDEYGLLLMIEKGRVWVSNPNQTNNVDVFRTSVTINGSAMNWKSSDSPYEILTS